MESLAYFLACSGKAFQLELARSENWEDIFQNQTKLKDGFFKKKIPIQSQPEEATFSWPEQPHFFGSLITS